MANTFAGPADTMRDDLARGREETINLVHELHGRALFRYLLRVTLGDRREAEDLVQETLLRAWIYFENREFNPAAARPWLFTVARRLAIDAGRARRARPTEVVVEDLAVLPATHAMERFVDAVHMRRQLASLGPDQRRVLVEVFYFGRSAREAAEVIGIPEGTVKSRMFYALRTLRTQLSELAEGS